MKSNMTDDDREPAPIRVGAVSYLNTRPLVHRLTEIAPYIRLTFDLPSRLAASLASGELDVALIPSVEAFQDPGYRILSDACIGCRGPVLSVKLFSRRPLADIRTLALDEGSRTSAALVQILLRQQYGIRPSLLPLPIGHSTSDSDADAILLIGDRAMHRPDEPFVATWDLGEQWCRRTGLPFVFAMWTARPGFESNQLEADLAQSRSEGVADVAAIAAREAPRVGLPEDVCLAYLRDNLHFYLGPPEKRALKMFHEQAQQLEIVPPGPLTLFDATRPPLSPIAGTRQ